MGAVGLFWPRLGAPSTRGGEQAGHLAGLQWPSLDAGLVLRQTVAVCQLAKHQASGH